MNFYPCLCRDANGVGCGQGVLVVGQMFEQHVAVGIVGQSAEISEMLDYLQAKSVA